MCVLLIYFHFIQRAQKHGEKTSYPLAPSLDAHMSGELVNLKPGTQITIQVCHVALVPDLAPAPSQSVQRQKSELVVDLGLKPRRSDIECAYPKWVLNH